MASNNVRSIKSLTYVKGYMPHVPVNTNAPPGSDESEHMIDSACENASSRVWNVCHYTMSNDTRSKCFDNFEDYEATKYPNEYSYQNGYSSATFRQLRKLR
jgi:hypothetical protein